MITRTRQIARMLVAALLLAGGTAQATDYSECMSKDVLRRQLTQLIYTKFENYADSKDYQGMDAKIVAAYDKVEMEAKYCDGMQKLENLRTKLRQLVYESRKPKVIEDPDHPGTVACLFEGARLQIEDWRAFVAENGGDCDAAGDPPRGKGPKG